MDGWLEQYTALLVKDFKQLARRPHDMLALLTVSFTFSVIASYIVSAPGTPIHEYEDAALILALGQLAVLLTAGFTTGFLFVIREAEKGTLDGLRTAPLSAETIFLAKTSFILLVALGVSLAYTLLAAVFSAWYELLTPGYLALSVAVGLGVASISSLTGLMVSYSSESRNVLGVVVMASLATPFLSVVAPPLSLAAQGVEPELLPYIAAALGILVLSTILSKPLVEA